MKLKIKVNYEVVVTHHYIPRMIMLGLDKMIPFIIHLLKSIIMLIYQIMRIKANKQ